MSNKIFPAALVFIFLCTLSACNLPITISNISPGDLTAGVETAIAISVAQTLTGGQSVQIPEISETPPSSPEPSLTPQPTLTSTPTIPMITVSEDTNCRIGPGAVYPRVTTLNVGETSEVIARDPSLSSWYIRNPDNALAYCWVWGQYATVTGNVSILPIYTPLPPPAPTSTSTPVIDFTAAYKATAVCGGMYAPTFTINNIGILTWQAIQITITDTVTATAKTHTADTFDAYAACPLILSQQDLTQGESGDVTATTNPFNYNFAGHAMQATIKVCSQNGMGGTCMIRTINFTP